MAFRKKDDIGSLLQGSGSRQLSLAPKVGVANPGQLQPTVSQSPVQQMGMGQFSRSNNGGGTQPISFKPIAQPSTGRKIVQSIQDFTAQSNRALGDTNRGIVKSVNLAATGFNEKEAEKRTADFLRTTGQTGPNSLTKGTSENSQAGQIGRTTGKVGKFAGETASVVLPGAAATRGLQGLNAIKNLSNAGRAGKIGAEIASNVGGGLVSSGVSQTLDPSQNITQNLGTGAAIDTGLSLLGPAGNAAGRLVARARQARRVGQLADEAGDVASVGRTVEDIQSARREGEAGREEYENRFKQNVTEEELDKYIRRPVQIRDTFVAPGQATQVNAAVTPNTRTVRLTSSNTQNPLTETTAGRPIATDAPQMVRVTDSRVSQDTNLTDQANQLIRQARQQEIRQAPQLEQDLGAQLPDRDVAQEIAQAAQERKNRYSPATIREKLGEAINPYRAGARIDAEAARRAGIPQRDLPKNQSLEALAERARNSGQEAEEYLRSSNIAPVVQKYGAGTPESAEFNTYRTFMRDLEQRADGRPALYRDYSDDELINFVRNYEARNPDVLDELRALVQDIKSVQDEAIRRGVVDADTVDRARTKKDGSQYEFYTPVSRATPEELERATINANGVSGGARQTIIQDMKGSDIPLDPSFDSITDYVNNAYRQMAKAETSQLFANRVREGLVPGARFTDTSENSAARKAMIREQKATGVPKDMNNYAELQADPTTGLQVITGRENGNTFKIEVPPEQARFLQGLGQEQLNSVLKLAKQVQTPFRTVLTGALNLPFQVISAGYNAIMSPTLSPQGFRVLAPSAAVEAIKSLNRNSDFQQLLRREGAQQFTGNLEARGRTTTAEALAAQRDFASRFKFNATSPGRLWEKLDIPGSKIEGAQRTGIAKAAFDARLRNGGDEAEAIADAVYAYNNVLPNFGRTSSAVRQADALAMYTGASVAGTRSLLTAIKRDPVGVSTRLALTTGAMTGLAAYSMSQDEAQAFYEDMKNSGKGYIVDNNGILVLPGAHKVTKEEAQADPNRKEGEWEGVVKIPLPPELRPVQKAISAQVLANAQEANIPIGDYGVALFDFVSGSARTLANPAVDLVYGLSTNVDRMTGREIVPTELQRKDISEQKFSTTSPLAVQLGQTLGVSPLKVDYLLGKSGFPGQIAKGVGSDGGPIGAAAKSIENRFTNTFGQKESTKFFNSVDEIAKSIKNDDDMKAFEALHANKGDGAKSIDKTAERYKTLLARPAVLEAERELDRRSRAEGKPGNPLFDLAPDQQEKVFRYRASKDLNSAKQSYDKNGNPLYTSLGLDEKWYDDFRNAETAFYTAIKDSGNEENNPLTLSGAKKPTASPELQAKLDTYYTLPSGTGERSNFLKGNPDVLEHWAAGDQFTNAERVAIGLKPTSDDSDSSSGSGKSSSFARSRGSSGGRSGSRITIKSSDYDGTIGVDKAPSVKITANNDKPKVQVKKRQPRKAKVTSTKVKA